MMASWPAAASVYDVIPSMDVVRSRLSLTPEQEAQLRPLFQRRESELQKTREQIEQSPSRQEKRSILHAAKKQGDAFNAEVEKILNTQQKTQWRELRKETREKVRERVEEKRDSHPRAATP